MKLSGASLIKLIGPKHKEILQGTCCKKYAIAQCISQEQDEKLVVVECDAVIDPEKILVII